MEIYKIRNKEGLYWEGHGVNNFTIKGKTWKQINHAKSAITNAKRPTWSVLGLKYWELKDYYSNKELFKDIIPNYLKDCEIVKFELKEVETIKIN